MASRQYRTDSRTAGAGEVFIDVSFVTAGASNPTSTYTADGTNLRGAGIASVVHAATGNYTVTLTDNFRWAIGKFAALEANAAGDGSYATITAASNEGTTSPLTFTVFTHVAAGTLTDFTGRRVSLGIVAKNSMVGV